LGQQIGSPIAFHVKSIRPLRILGFGIVVGEYADQVVVIFAKGAHEAGIGHSLFVRTTNLQKHNYPTANKKYTYLN